MTVFTTEVFAYVKLKVTVKDTAAGA